MSKTWDEMTPHEKEMLVAEKVMGVDLSVVCPGGMDDYDGAAVCSLCGYETGWGEELKHTAQPAHYTTDHNACRLVEDAIERQGTRYYYLLALYRITCDVPDMQRIRMLHFTECWYMILATPEQKCRAAVRAMGVEV